MTFPGNVYNNERRFPCPAVSDSLFHERCSGECPSAFDLNRKRPCINVLFTQETQAGPADLIRDSTFCAFASGSVLCWRHVVTLPELNFRIKI
jgi:hypothetical protein